MNADKIVAQPGTITASIGVLGGKLLMNGLFDKLGLSFDAVKTSENSGMFTSTEDYSPQEWDKFQQWLDRVYDDFTSKVAEGRKLPKEKVLQIAKGRIWSGEDAKGVGLVDELGGFPLALKLAKEAAGIGRYRARRETAELELQERRGELARADDIIGAWSRVLGSCRARLLGLPNKVAPLARGAASDLLAAKVIEANVHEALEDPTACRSWSVIDESRSHTKRSRNPNPNNVIIPGKVKRMKETV